MTIAAKRSLICIITDTATQESNFYMYWLALTNTEHKKQTMTYRSKQARSLTP